MNIRFFITYPNCFEGTQASKFAIYSVGDIRLNLKIKFYKIIHFKEFFINMLINKVKDYQKIAKQKLSQEVFSYFFSGSDDQITLKNNVQAYSTIKLYPRVLRDMREISLKTKILGRQVDLPFGVAPFAMQKLLHSDGQLISSKIAKQRKTAYGYSMLATTKISQISKQPYNSDGLKIMQLYFLKNSQYTKKIVKFVQDHGFSALAITVDTQIFGKRRRDDKNKFSPKVQLQVFKDMGINLKFRSSQLSQSFIHSINNEINWDFISQIKKITKLKIILKGIMDPDDAQKAYQCGVDAIWISNHGGRQLDTSPATIWVLPAIKQRIISLEKQYNRKVEIYIDGGIWKGSDIFKCLALGADFVFVGRAFLFSIIDGQKGMNNSFDMLTHELKNTMILCGTHSVKQINDSYIYNQPSKL